MALPMMHRYCTFWLKLTPHFLVQNSKLGNFQLLIQPLGWYERDLEVPMVHWSLFLGLLLLKFQSASYTDLCICSLEICFTVSSELHLI